MKMRSTVLLLRDAVDLWIERHAFQHAGALAFYTLFSLAPLTIIIVALVGFVFGEEAARGDISAGISGLVGEPAALAVEEAVRRSRVEEAGWLPTAVGLGALAFGATTVFVQVQSSLNQFWGVIAKPTRSGMLAFLKTRLLSLAMVIIIGFLMLTSFIMSIAIAVLIRYAEHRMPVPHVVLSGVDTLASLLVATLVFGMIFKMLPDVVLRWGDVSKAAMLTALLFVAGQYFISWYLTEAAPASVYGAAGSLVLVLFWVYYSALILFFGVSVAKCAILRRDGHVTAKKTAVRISMVMLETDVRASVEQDRGGGPRPQ